MKNIQDKYKQDMKLRKCINMTKKAKPYVDQKTGRVFWGTDASSHKGEKVNEGDEG